MGLSSKLAVGQTSLSVTAIAIDDESDEKDKNGKKDESRAVTTPPVDRQRVNQLLAQLGSPKFANRQDATEQLWRLGSGAAKQLTAAKQSANPDVAKRLAGIIQLMELGLDPNSNPEFAQLVLHFVEDSDPRSGQRATILNGLVQSQQFDLFFALLERVSDIRDRDVLLGMFNLDDAIRRLGVTGNWAQIRSITSNPIPLNMSPRLRLQHCYVQGTLESEAKKLRAEIDLGIQTLGPVTEADIQSTELTQTILGQARWGKALPVRIESEPERERAIARYALEQKIHGLISILRFTDQSESALPLVKHLSSPVIASQLKQLLLMEQGKWDDLLAVSRIVDLTANEHAKQAPKQNPAAQAGELNWPITLVQKGLAQKFANDSEGLAQTIQQMEQRLVADDQNVAVRDDLAKLWFFAGNWDNANRYLDKDSPLDLFRTLRNMNRYGPALESVGIKGGAKQRFEWLQSKMEEIKKLNSEQDKGNRRLVSSQIDNLFELVFAVANVYESLGLTEEAVIYCRYLETTISETDNSATTKRGRVISMLMDLHHYDEAWQMILDRVGEQSYQTLFSRTFSSITRNKNEAANYWYSNSMIREKYPDNLERLKLMLGIVNSPMAAEDFDIIQFVDQLDTTPSFDPTASFLNSRLNYYVALAMKYHGLNDRAQLHLQRAADGGDLNAIFQLADQALEKGKFRTAAELYDSIWLSNPIGGYRTPSSESLIPQALLKSITAYQQLGDTDAVQRRRMCSIRGLTGTQVIGYQTPEIEQELTNLQRLTCYATQPGDASISNFWRTAGVLATVLEKKDPAQSQSLQQILLTRTIAGNFELVSINYIRERNVGLLAAILKKDFDSAEKIATRLFALNPGDSGLGESCFHVLDQAGQTELADRLFSLSSEFYYDLLQQYPQSPLHLNNFAWMCATCNRKLEVSLSRAELALKLRPNNSSYLDTLAELCFLNGDVERANQLIDRCIQVSPTKPHYQQQKRRFSR